MGEGRFAEAEREFAAVLKAAPANARGHFHLAAACAAQARWPEAVSALDAAIALEPLAPANHYARAAALLALGLPGQAAEAARRTLALAPGHVMARVTLGEALTDQGHEAEARTVFDEALAQAPDLASQMAQHAGVLINADKFEEALELCDRALLLVPANVKALNHRGVALFHLDRAAEAEDAYARALAADPEAADVWCNIATLKLAARGYDDALAAFNAALTLNPGLTAARINRGSVLLDLECFEEARADFETAHAADPDQIWIKANLLAARADICDWRDYETLRAEVIAGVRAGKRRIAPFEALSQCDDPADQLAATRTMAEAVIPARPLARRASAPRGGKIRLAYLSADFRSHAVAHLAAELFERHDRSAFEVIGLAVGPASDDAMRARLSAAFDTFADVPALSDRDLATLIQGLDVDIAIDLTGFTANGRTAALAFRPAPVQVNFLGFPGTLGAPFIDYIIGDPVVTPPGCETDFAEQIVRLPVCYQPNSTRPIYPDPVCRTEFGLPEGAVVFAAFNNPFKITPAVFDAWMRILKACEGSVLWLYAKGLAAENLKREAAARGLAPDRLVFAEFALQDPHLARLGLADIQLDTSPYGGHTTTSDALWAGVPVVTCAGQTFASRVGASLVAAAGAPELNTASMAAYEQLAIGLAQDPIRREALKARLARTRKDGPLFSIAAYTRHLEAAFTRMAERWRAGKPAAGFDLA